MTAAGKWGVVATIKAPVDEILAFVAYHLDLGASQLFIFLDDDNPAAEAALAPHGNVTVIRTDEAYWHDRLGRRPVKHQVRQVRNATLAYRKAKDLDWIAHIDVDEFLCPTASIEQLLTNTAPNVQALRLSPYESLCIENSQGLDPELTYCKAKIPGGDGKQTIEAEIYPQFGGFFKSGFISHSAGKLFVRTNLGNVKLAIHRAFYKEDDEITALKCDTIDLCHKHVASWDKWLQIMEYRLQKGSYRAELEQNLPTGSGRLSKHAVFSSLTAEGTEDLRLFFEETCLATPKLLERLSKRDLLRSYKLGLSSKIEKHFPNFKG